MLDGITTSRFCVLLPEEGGWQATIQQLLEPQGIQTLVARTGRQALQIMESQSVHAAVIPQDMPSLNGLQVIKRMNGMAHRPPAILLANRMTNHLLHEALSMHVFSVLSRPVDMNLLLDAFGEADAPILRKPLAYAAGGAGAQRGAASIRTVLI